MVRLPWLGLLFLSCSPWASLFSVHAALSPGGEASRITNNFLESLPFCSEFSCNHHKDSDIAFCPRPWESASRAVSPKPEKPMLTFHFSPQPQSASYLSSAKYFSNLFHAPCHYSKLVFIGFTKTPAGPSNWSPRAQWLILTSLASALLSAFFSEHLHTPTHTHRWPS